MEKDIILALQNMIDNSRFISGSFALRDEFGWNKDCEKELDHAESVLENLKKNR